MLNAFFNFLSSLPDEIQLTQEAFDHALFITVMTNQYFESELSVAGGRLDLHSKAPEVDDFIIEIKHHQKNQNLTKMIQLAFDQIIDNIISISMENITESEKLKNRLDHWRGARCDN
ncbi:MAG: hypothetical protein LBR11_05430 [Deltaproteobacteria bacterium]|jgi:hypothetical protein|nr:hypothetical protein [Deltaproteobacteria bacterium]